MRAKKNAFGASGFTLIELMIVVAIIGILAAIAIPKFAELIRKSNEGASKGNLGAIRSALSIYYGDEVGMWGADDPTNRKPMLWADLGPYENPEQNFIMEDHHAFYREAIALRRAHEVLRVGDFETHLTDDEQDLWVFLRTLGDEVLMVALNAGAEVSSFTPPPIEGEWSPVFGEEAVGEELGASRMAVGPIAGRVWRWVAPGR